MRGSVRGLGWVVAVLWAVVPAVRAADHPYLGAKKCKMCHLKEYNSWAETRMAKAFELLKPGVAAAAKKTAKLDPNKDYTTDPVCLGCHTTGHGKKGGFVDAASTPDLVGVQCEMCHGPAGTYIQKEYMSLQNKEFKRAAVVAVGLVAPVTKDQCVACHNPKSPFYKEFNFEQRVKEGTHEKIPLKYSH